MGKKQVLALLLVFVLSMSILTACGKKDGVPEPGVSSTEPEAPQEVEPATRVIKDMAGREIEIPTKIEKVFTTSSVGTIALYSINPSLIAGLNSDVTELEEKYLTKEYTSLPVLGRYKAGDSANEEEILKAAPDIILSMGDIDERWISEADEAQEKLGIPFLMIDGDMENMDATYEFLGDILGEEERCKVLADYVKETIEDTKKIADTIAEDERVRVYYGSGEPLSTNVAGSIHAQAIDLIGAINVADVTVEKATGTVEVSIEEVLNWDPDLIIAVKDSKEDESSYEIIKTDPKWANISAVKEGHVYAIPNAPFNWFDRPPSINRLMGVRWLGNLVYPEYFDIDIKQETKDFYELFYHRPLTDDEVDEILENAIR